MFDKPPEKKTGCATWLVLAMVLWCIGSSAVKAFNDSAVRSQSPSVAPHNEPDAAVLPPFDESTVRRYVMEQGCLYPREERECTGAALAYVSTSVTADRTVHVRLLGTSMDSAQVVCTWLALQSASPVAGFRRVEVRSANGARLANGFMGRPCVRANAPIIDQISAR